MQVFPEAVTWPRRVRSGKSAVEWLVREAACFGVHGAIVHGRSVQRSGHVERCRQSCPKTGELVFYEHGGGEPTLEQVQELREWLRQHQVDWIAAIGGGSVLDLAKAGAGLVHAPGTIRDYHRGEPIRTAALPFLAAPAVAGSGSEATGVAVLTDPDSCQKKAIRSDGMFPWGVILDPSLPASCPASVVAHSGLDGLTQSIESYFSQGARPLTEDLALRGLRLFADNLPAAVRQPDSEAMANIQAASFVTGLAFSVSRLGVVHGLVHPLGARTGLPHGLLCGLCLPLALEFNREAVPDKYAELSRLLGQDPVAFVKDLHRDLGLDNPLLHSTIPDWEGIAVETMDSGSTAHNPRPVSQEDVSWFLCRLVGHDGG